MAETMNTNNVEVKVIKKKRSFIVSFICFLLTFLFGFISAFGALALVGYLAVTKWTVADIDNKQKSLSGTSIVESGYVSDEVAEKTLLELFTTLGGVLNGNSTINDLSALSPMIAEKVDSLITQINGYNLVQLDATEIKAKKLSEVPSYLQASIQNIEIAGILFNNETIYKDQNEILMRLCFGDDYVINADNTVTGTKTKISEISTKFNNIVDTITIPTVMDVDPSSTLMMYLSYGKFDYATYVYSDTNTLGLSAGKRYISTDGKFLAKKDAEDGKFYLYTEDISKFIMTAVGADTLHYFVGNDGKKLTVEDIQLYKYAVPPETEDTLVVATPIENVSSKTETMKDDLMLKDLMTINETSSKVLQSLKNSTINGLDASIKSLKISDMIEINEDDKILNCIKNSTVESLSTDINSMTVQELYYEDIYDYRELTTTEISVGVKSGVKYYTYDTVTNDYVYETALTSFASGISYFVRGEMYQATSFDANDLYYTFNAAANRYELQTDLTSLSGGTYYTRGSVVGIWKYMLCEGAKEEKVLIENIGSTMSNVSTNISTATIQELYDDGLITGTDPSTISLNKVPTYSTQTLGDLTTSQMIDLVITMIGLIP